MLGYLFKSKKELEIENIRLVKEQAELSEKVRVLNELASDTSERDSLRNEISNLKVELTEVKHKKKLEEEDIKHLVKINKEKTAIELEKKIIELEREQQAAIAKVKDEYQNKMEVRLQSEVEGMKTMYAQILERLPNLSARLSGEL